jgi:hypothetical protein
MKYCVYLLIAVFTYIISFFSSIYYKGFANLTLLKVGLKRGRARLNKCSKYLYMSHFLIFDWHVTKRKGAKVAEKMNQKKDHRGSKGPNIRTKPRACIDSARQAPQLQ